MARGSCGAKVRLLRAHVHTFARRVSPRRADPEGIDGTLVRNPMEDFFSKIIRLNSIFGTPEGSFSFGVRNAHTRTHIQHTHATPIHCNTHTATRTHIQHTHATPIQAHTDTYKHTYTHIHLYRCMGSGLCHRKRRRVDPVAFATPRRLYGGKGLLA